MKHYKKVAVGGTFDHLHKGHEELLSTAFSISDRVVIGITTQKMVEGKTLSSVIEPYASRVESVTEYLNHHGYLRRATIISLNDEYGPSLSDDSIEAVVVGPRVSKKAVVAIRKKKDVVSCKTIFSKDKSHLSSTRIRAGEITRTGIVRTIPIKDLSLPQNLRTVLRKPLGSYVRSLTSIKTSTPPMLISVGDATFIKLRAENILPDLAVLDGMIRRKQMFTEEQMKSFAGRTYEFIRTENLAGSLSKNMMVTIKDSIDLFLSKKTRRLIRVRGEDDLAVLAAVYFAPLTSLVVYGQPSFPTWKIKPGMIGVEVTEEKKKLVSDLIKKFISS